jgi:hypothetical protein
MFLMSDLPSELYDNIPGLLDGQGVRLKIITAVNERPNCGVTDKDWGVYLVGLKFL